MADTYSTSSSSQLTPGTTNSSNREVVPDSVTLCFFPSDSRPVQLQKFVKIKLLTDVFQSLFGIVVPYCNSVLILKLVF
jgi:hypothetical protein